MIKVNNEGKISFKGKLLRQGSLPKGECVFENLFLEGRGGEITLEHSEAQSNLLAQL